MQEPAPVAPPPRTTSSGRPRCRAGSLSPPDVCGGKRFSIFGPVWRETGGNGPKRVDPWGFWPVRRRCPPQRVTEDHAGGDQAPRMVRDCVDSRVSAVHPRGESGGSLLPKVCHHVCCSHAPSPLPRPAVGRGSPLGLALSPVLTGHRDRRHPLPAPAFASVTEATGDVMSSPACRPGDPDDHHAGRRDRRRHGLAVDLVGQDDSRPPSTRTPTSPSPAAASASRGPSWPMRPHRASPPRPSAPPSTRRRSQYSFPGLKGKARSRQRTRRPSSTSCRSCS